MNKEEFQKNEAGIEVEDRPEITSPEQSKNSQEWANEILIKIEQEFNSIPDNVSEINKIDDSISLENQSTKNEIKDEINLDNKLGGLDNEAKLIKDETKSKISEITGLGKEAQLELSEFSKRYSAFYRDQIAQKINNLRFQYQSKLKEKPAEVELLKTSIKDEISTINEISNEKTKDEEIQKNLEKERVKLNSEIEDIKINLDKRKNSFIYKIRQKFSSDKMEINEELVELFKSEGLDKQIIKNKLYQKDFDMVQMIKDKKDLLDNIDISLDEKQKEINERGELMGQIRISIEDKYKAINETEEIINSDFEIKEIEKTINDFYGEMTKQKKQIESEKKERSIAEISKEKNILFCHSIPLEVITDTAFSQNNELVNTNRFGPEEKIKMILGVEPTISVSTINKENQTLVGGFGLILKEGQVLSSYGGDAGTLLDKGIYNRKSKYDRSLKTTIIQEDPENSINRAINHEAKNENSAAESMHQGWNEIVVENPQAAGLFFQKNNPNSPFSNMAYAKKISKDLNLPLYIFDNEKIYRSDDSTNELVEIDREEIFNSSKTFSPDEKKNMIEEMIDKESFNIKKENIYKFNGYNVGRAYYKFIKKIDAGERVSIRHIEKDEVLDEGDEIIRLVDHSFAIKKNKLDEKQWELFGREHWEKYEKYYKEDNENDNSEYNFNTKFGSGNVWEPNTRFIVEGDSISSYIDMARRELDRLEKQGEEWKKKDGDINELVIRNKSIIFILFGVMEECQKSGDTKNFEKAKSIIEKSGNLQECKTFIEKRVGKDDNFKYLNEDAPIEIRKKIKELDSL